MPNIFDGFLTQITKGDSVKDFRHASRLFVDNNYELAPKYTWLFHVFFDLNPEIANLPERQQIEAGMLVKSADLPRFRIESKTYNNYNRPYVAQTKVRYEELNINFHDDTSNLIRKLWFDYFNYYYRDMDNSYGDADGALNQVYIRSNLQVLGQRNLYNKFGYGPTKQSYNSKNYINAIRIYSLHQKKFSEYTILNPIITSFRHGTHVNGQDGTLENTMTIAYESVLYASGSASVARGFADLHYDKSPSPLTVAGGGTNSILGPGGIVNALDDVIRDGSDRKWGSSAFKLLRGFEKNKNTNFLNLAQGELTQSLTNILRSTASGGGISGGINAASNQTYFPYRGVDSAPPFQPASPIQGTAAPGSVSSNGFNVTAVGATVTAGIASAIKGNPIAAVGSQISGLATNLTGRITGADPNKIVNLAKNPVGGLTGTGTSSLPSNSLQAAIEKANNRNKSLALNDVAKTAAQVAGASTPLLTQLNPTVAAFTTGTNLLTTATNGLDVTPLRNLQVPANSQVAADIANFNLTADAGLSTAGKTSTNAAGSGFVNGNFGSVNT
jgi:hypothetical protein